MKQPEIDKLVGDIQDFLNKAAAQGGFDEASYISAHEGAGTGIFIPAGSRRKMDRFLDYSRYACYLAEALTIALLTAVVVSPFDSWPRTAMFVVGALLFGVFAVTLLLGMQARIRLLLRIEENTQRIAQSKAHIAQTLDKLRVD